jgi:cytidine deaminase
VSNGGRAQVIAKQPAEEKQQSVDAISVDQLSFLDLLYAVPVADLAIRVSGATLSQVSSATWSALAVILAVITLSWIGLHKNRAAMAADNSRSFIGKIDFLSLRFIQFLIEIIIVGLYFAMGLKLNFPKSGELATPAEPEEWITAVLFCIFSAYFVWDLIDIRQAHMRKVHTWCRQARKGAYITFVFLLLSIVIWLIVIATHPRTAAVLVLCNIGLLIFVWSYRVVQDQWGNTRSDALPGLRLRVSGREEARMSPAIDPTVRNLCKAAQNIAKSAYAKYSDFRVGAVLITATGQTYKAANVENASYGLTLCAERAVIAQAVTAGETGLLRLAVACIDAGTQAELNKIMPCGACRQWFIEFAPDLEVFVIDNTDRIFNFSARELLPTPFTLDA